jgi:hypothetical protein
MKTYVDGVWSREFVLWSEDKGLDESLSMSLRFDVRATVRSMPEDRFGPAERGIDRIEPVGCVLVVHAEDGHHHIPLSGLLRDTLFAIVNRSRDLEREVFLICDNRTR